MAEERGLGTAYLQDGKVVPHPALVEALNASPAAAPLLDGYQTKAGAASLLAVVGGGLVGYGVGYNLTTTGKKSWTLPLVGVGVTAIAIPLGLWADSQLKTAVAAHNASVAAPRSSGLSTLAPFAEVSADGRGGRKCEAGIALRF